MPPRPRHPGVYVEEIPSGVQTITGVPTSIALFIGMARQGEEGRPVAIRSHSEFEQIFGSDVAYGELELQIKQFFLNGGVEAIVVRIVGEGGSHPEPGDYENLFRALASEVDHFNVLVLPRGVEQTDDQRQRIWGAASVFCQRHRAFLIVDPRADWNAVSDVADGIAALRVGSLIDHAAIYWPRIHVASVTWPVDPAGTIAGIIARTDTQRGVWKAPAGRDASILGITGLEHVMSNAGNNVTNPQGVNALRQFPFGVVVWGARTMAGFDNSGEYEYKYITVRRTALFIEKSLSLGLEFALYEQNNNRLWAQVRLAVNAFMHNLYLQGAFQGAKASDAYFVRCDASTTTQNDINQGRLSVVVGFAPVRPAEFVILKVQQSTGSPLVP
ncbi:phage tail sheath family protein [Marinobacter sp.]|uniref:phage tail sheath family protein n=1 Tax=Marinobacter sp. TaxID=50741 RepID=UPI00356582E4